MRHDDWPDPTKPPLKPMDISHPSAVISCVGWNTLRPGNEGRGEIYRRIYRVLIDFMQDNELLTRTILEPGDFVADDTAIRVCDLTKEGMHFMRTGYEKWGEKVDRGMDPSDTTILEKALKIIRSGEVGKYEE